MGARLEGNVTVITGATSGIGEATAHRFAEEGARLVLAARSVDKGQRLAAELAEQSGTDAPLVRTDVSHEAEMAALMDAAVARFGRLDCLFNNAGAGERSTAQTITQEDFDATMRLLAGSVAFGIKHAALVMKANGGGSIINNASIAGHRLGQGGYLYSGAKAAVSHFTRMAGVELGPSGIRVNAISPGATATPIF